MIPRLTYVGTRQHFAGVGVVYFVGDAASAQQHVQQQFMHSCKPERVTPKERDFKEEDIT